MSTGKTPFLQRKGTWIIAAVCALTLAAALFFLLRKKEELLNVPLGVEQAAIVTYSGPEVAVAPYKWGVAVNVRIAEMTERPDTRIYDIRYVVNRAGTWDLKDYLIAADGTRLDGLPSFKFRGDPKLSKDLDARIQETEAAGVKIGGRYYETLAALGVLWIAWLLLIIFYKRTPPPPEPMSAPPAATLAEMLRAFLAQLDAGTLDAEAKAKMEMLLLRRWREELALSDVPMSAVLDAIKRDEKTGSPLRQVQDWLHRPASQVQREEIAAALTPFTVEPPPSPNV